MLRAEPNPVFDVRIGVFYTAVQLGSEHVGVGFTPRGLADTVCCPKSAAAAPPAGRIIGMDAWELARYAFSHAPLCRAVGVATLNALSALAMDRTGVPGGRLLPDTDALEAIAIESSDHVAMVGAFIPFIKSLRDEVETLSVIDKHRDALWEVVLRGEGRVSVWKDTQSGPTPSTVPSPTYTATAGATRTATRMPPTNTATTVPTKPPTATHTHSPVPAAPTATLRTPASPPSSISPFAMTLLGLGALGIGGAALWARSSTPAPRVDGSLRVVATLENAGTMRGRRWPLDDVAQSTITVGGSGADIVLTQKNALPQGIRHGGGDSRRRNIATVPAARPNACHTG